MADFVIPSKPIFLFAVPFSGRGLPIPYVCWGTASKRVGFLIPGLLMTENGHRQIKRLGHKLKHDAIA
jgi:alpha-D-ribose 1-methylphosphonate 5-phosphate C-P lyase